ncbi:helix-turn-helix domain-containing GNAT family N-acetyltransferase [Psychrobium sp. 1_MG-2023]|uniref:bifunctional helix-turn-helix transcriptional regulator/GNAT family N-acetyltransferase n=1 Tax=Psychrobium sp. 1_MG-2023 TaxID=3062624 RepID=UPI000C3408C8|nr:helix-turn-helix domain-containing GNAT family N-acetyltransferase [Psychrobium sp. 1_MG-2023]MDP2561399.1 helix-turn-helix domain-containing GNAT family N-acetyltransferase [Psychrobium sp. 1_MG-2023]PKF54877.1 MarR family transcriptional regulator [Alteromonadales bacterium alter-6D02]
MKSYNELGHVALGTALRNLAAQVSQDAENIYQQFNFDIEPKWFPVFYVLASKGANSVVNIAKEIKHSHVSVSKIIKEMKKADLIESFKSSDDSRITLISLNERAKHMIPAMEKQCAAVDLAMQRLNQEAGIDLWQALNVTQQHLKYHPLSSRVDEQPSENAIRIVDYEPKYQAAFKQMNVEWISQYWELETPDYQALDNPEQYITEQSGHILIALYNGEAVGCCALIKYDRNTWELAKMAVSPSARGKGIGLVLGQKIIEKARQLGAKRLYLESNDILVHAVDLYVKLGFKHIDGPASPYERCNVQMELYL